MNDTDDENDEEYIKFDEYYSNLLKAYNPSSACRVGAMDYYHGMDRITSLPESVMSNVLSRLTTKDAVRTSILSRDWKHKWNSIDKIDINDDNGKSWIGNDRIASFYSFLDMITDTNPDLSIRRFHLYLGYETHEAVSNHLERWICKILRRHVESLFIKALSTEGQIVLSECIERFGLLPNLNLCLNGTLRVCHQNCFPKLKSLSLSGRFGSIQISNETSPNTGQLLLSFPVLKDLTLDHFEFLNVELVEINAPELLTFKACVSYNRNDYVIKIHAPKVWKFESNEGPAYEFVPCPPLLRYLDLVDEVSPTQSFALQILDVLKRAPSLKYLHLSGPIVEALGHGTRIPTLHQLEKLKLTNARAKVIREFLQSTPFLKSLTLSIEGVDYKQLEPLPPCIVSGLQEVTIIDLEWNPTQIGIAKLFFENAEKLVRVIIDTRYREDMMDVNAETNRWIEEIGPENAKHFIILQN